MKKFSVLVAMTFALSILLFSAPALAKEMHGATEMQSKANMRTFYSSEDLVGKTVVSKNGEKIGRLENVIISDNGRLEYAVVSSSGFLGIIGRKHTAVPWNMIRQSEDQTLMVNASMEKFKNAPAFSERKFSPEWEQEVNSYYGAEPGTTYRMEHGQPGVYEKSGEHAGEYGMKYGTLTTRDLTGKKVAAENGEQVGTVHDLIVGKDGKIQYLILSLDARRGELVAVPWQLAEYTPGTTMLFLAVSRDKIDNAPKFEKTDLEKFDSPEWNRKIYSYYGLEYEGKGSMQKGSMHKGSMMEKGHMGEMHYGY